MKEMETPAETLAQRLQRLREEKGYSKQKVSRKTNISPTSIRLLETGDVKLPAFHMMVRLSELYEVPLESWVPYIMANVPEEED
jgi:transcriptional regulator with XRE-family HTH domain